MPDYIRQYTDPSFPHERDEAIRLANDLINETSITPEGVIRWNSNGRVPPKEVVELAAFLHMPVDTAACDSARDVELAAFFAEYRAAREHGPSSEERAMARSAHGSGVDLIDVITGLSWTT